MVNEKGVFTVILMVKKECKNEVITYHIKDSSIHTLCKSFYSKNDHGVKEKEIFVDNIIFPHSIGGNHIVEEYLNYLVYNKGYSIVDKI